MANTVSPRIYTEAFPLITVNSLKYVLYKSSDPTVEVTSQTFAAPHPVRAVTFPGMLRTNYIFKLLEMNGATVVAQKAQFEFVPDNSDFRYKAPIEIQADVTTGIVSGVNTFTMDGTGGTDDWRGWDVYIERVGQGTMQKGVAYSWDAVTGIFTLLVDGDLIQPSELFNVEFGLIISTGAGVPPQQLYTGKLVITGTTTLTAADIGKKIIIKGASAYFEITLPDLTTVTELMPTYFEAGIGAHTCVKIKTFTGQTIDWMKGARNNLKIGVCESFVLYKELSPLNWRVDSAIGNFLTVGRIITSDADLTVQEFNCVAMDGSSLSTSNYARLYEDFVQQLPPAQVCNFADWTLGENKYKFSYASAGVFKVPDRRNLYLRNSDGSILPGVYQADNVGSFSGQIGLPHGQSPYSGNPNVPRIANPGANNVGMVDHPFTYLAAINDTRPKSFITRQFILV